MNSKMVALLLATGGAIAWGWALWLGSDGFGAELALRVYMNITGVIMFAVGVGLLFREQAD